MTALFHRRQTVDGFIKDKKVGNSTILILNEAEKLGVNWEKIPYTPIFKLDYEGQTRYFHGQIPSATTELASFCCTNKATANGILAKAGVSVCKGLLIKPTDPAKYRRDVYRSLTKPLVVKPADGMRGESVFLNITSLQQFQKAFQAISVSSENQPDILVEEMFDGAEYRILATPEKILSVIQRLPANVVGNGVSTIAELVEVKNQDPIRIKVSTYSKLVIDNEVESHLALEGRTLQSVPARGERVFLREHSPLDISLGGDTVDVTDEIHPSVHQVVKNVMKSIPGLALTGIDYMAQDIRQLQTMDNYRVIEINASPSLDWNQYPLEGPRRPVAYEFLKIMFPKLH